MNQATWEKSSSKEEKNSINSGKVSNNCKKQCSFRMKNRRS